MQITLFYGQGHRKCCQGYNIKAYDKSSHKRTSVVHVVMHSILFFVVVNTLRIFFDLSDLNRRVRLLTLIRLERSAQSVVFNNICTA